MTIPADPITLPADPLSAPVESDALVLFGATGDLAHKKIFPALYAMAKRGALSVPVIGVARSKWDLPRFQARVRDSILEDAGRIDDERALEQVTSLVRYVEYRLQRSRQLLVAARSTR